MADEIDGLLVEIGLTERQYQQALARIERQTTKSAKSAEKAWERQNNKFVQGAQRAGGASANMGRNVQNAAFQIGDFAVQVGAGTSASRALAQQLPQLLGGFGVMGAVAGAAAAIILPLGAHILGLGDSAGSSKEQIDGLNKAIDELKSAQDALSSSDVDLASTYGLAIEQARELLDIERRRQQLGAESSLAAGAAGISDTLGPGIMDFLTASSATIPFGGLSRAASELQIDLKASGDEIRTLIRLLDAVGDAQGPAEQAAAIRAAREHFIGLAGSIQKANEIAPQLLDSFTQMEDAALRLQAIRVSEEGVIQAQTAEAKELLSTLKQEAEMQQLVAMHGEDSLAVARARVKAEREAFEETLATMQVSEELKDELRTAWDNANGVASVDMSGNITLAADEAARLSENLSRAIRLAPITPAMQDEDALMSQPVLSTASTRDAQRQAVENFNRIIAPKKKRGGGSKTKLASIFDASDKQIESLEVQIATLGLTSAAVAEYTTRQELLNEAKRRGLDLDAVNAETGESLRSRIDQQAAAVGRLTEQYDRLSEKTEFWNGLQQNLKDGLIDAIVEGESLAGVFADLAKQIAKAALQAALFNEGPMAIGGGSGGLLGGIFSGLFGGFRADGGPVKKGVPYVVGEKRPELFVPDQNGSIVPRVPEMGSLRAPAQPAPQVNVAPATPQVLILDDPRKIARFLGSAEGQAVFVDTAKRVGIS